MKWMKNEEYRMKSGGRIEDSLTTEWFKRYESGDHQEYFELASLTHCISFLFSYSHSVHILGYHGELILLGETKSSID